MLLIVVRLAALVPVHEQMTPIGYGVPVGALTVADPAAALVVALGDLDVLLLQPASTSTAPTSRTLPHRNDLIVGLLVLDKFMVRFVERKAIGRPNGGGLPGRIEWDEPHWATQRAVDAARAETLPTISVPTTIDK
jgi:hypothetical protein